MLPAENDGFHTRLGSTGLTISRLALGTVNFGGRVDEPDACKLLDHALASGVNLIDTADIYGWRVHQGYTEEMLGRWLAGGPGRREQVVLATKVGHQFGDGANDRGLSARHLIASCEASLRRLRTDWIDVYQMHCMDRTVRWDVVWQAMDTLVAQGKVRYVGSSNFAGWHIAAAQEAALRRGAVGLVSEQCIYNLLVRQAEQEVIPAARAYGLAVLAWSPLHGGLLSGVLRKMADGVAVKSGQGRSADALGSRGETVAAYERFCAELGRDPAEVGMAWSLSRPGVTGLVVGPRTAGHLDGAIRALSLGLADDELARLDELFPPAGESPEAWSS